MMSDGTITYNKKSLVRAIGKGVVVPIISNGFRMEEIFREDEELCRMMAEVPQFYDEFRTFDQQLTKKWAASVGYPMSDDHNLARVAQYLQVEQGNSSSRENYLQFLIDRLLTLSEQSEQYKSDENFQSAVSELRIPSKGQLPLFSDVASQLGYPQFPLPGLPGSEDPLRLLASMPVKVYITTR